jgi:hypothetical protein
MSMSASITQSLELIPAARQASSFFCCQSTLQLQPIHHRNSIAPDTPSALPSPGVAPLLPSAPFPFGAWFMSMSARRRVFPAPT